jgi:hypothetical protein
MQGNKKGKEYEQEQEQQECRAVGRPPHIPTDELRKIVYTLAFKGTPQVEIAEAIDLSEKTLRLYYKFELRQGRFDAHQNIRQHFYDRAFKSDRILELYLRTQLGIRDIVPDEPEEEDVMQGIVFNVIPKAEEDIAYNDDEYEPS